MNPVSETRLMQRNGVWYYRRRVPRALEGVIGRKLIQHSIVISKAKKLKAIEDVKSDALFETAKTNTSDV